MRCNKHPRNRNKIDLADPSQVRILKRRLGISDEQLRRMVEKAGNSISAVSKEVRLQKASPAEQPKPARIYDLVASPLIATESGVNQTPTLKNIAPSI
jgi:hypothetical protein